VAFYATILEVERGESQYALLRGILCNWVVDQSPSREVIKADLRTYQKSIDFGRLKQSESHVVASRLCGHEVVSRLYIAVIQKSDVVLF
jgi:hypothetical protein